MKPRPHRALPLSLASAVTAAAFLLAASFGGAASARDSAGAIKPVPRSDKGATSLARAIFESANRKLVRAKFVTVPPGGNPIGRSTKGLAGFPHEGGTFAVLSTGCAPVADRPDNSPRTGCRNGGVKTRGARDATVMRIRLVVPEGANCLSFRFKFLSEEYPEFVGTIFNDAFIAEVGKRAPRWKASGFRDPTISSPGNFATTRRGNDIISVNGTGVAKVSPAAAKGTTYDAATGKLRASTPVRPGPTLLYLSIFDQGDRQYDSAVFVDRLIVRHSDNCQSGLVRSG